MAPMTADQAREAAKGLTFEDVWAAMLKTDEHIKQVDEQIKQVDEQIKAMSQQADETSKEVAKTSKEVAKISKNLGGIGNTIGKMTEAMFSFELWKKFSVHGFKFTQGSSIKFSSGNQVLAEVDFFMENGDYAMPVEIKTELSVEDVDDHLKRMDKIRQYMDRRKDKRKLVGAVAGAVVAPNVVKYAQRKGFFVLVQTGDSIGIARLPKGFVPKEW
jgi:hypothetical protein